MAKPDMPMSLLKQKALSRAHGEAVLVSKTTDNQGLPAIRNGSVDILYMIFRHIDFPTSITTWTVLGMTSIYWRVFQKSLRNENWFKRGPLSLLQMLCIGNSYAARLSPAAKSRSARANVLLAVVLQRAGWQTGEQRYVVPNSITHTMSPQFPYQPDSQCRSFSIALQLDCLDKEEHPLPLLPLRRFDILWDCLHPMDKERIRNSFWHIVGDFKRDMIVQNQNVYALAKRAIMSIVSANGNLANAVDPVTKLQMCVVNTKRCWEPDCPRMYLRLRDINPAFFRNVGRFEECRDLLKALGWFEGEECLRFKATSDNIGMFKDHLLVAIRSVHMIANDVFAPLYT